MTGGAAVRAGPGTSASGGSLALAAWTLAAAAAAAALWSAATVEIDTGPIHTASGVRGDAAAAAVGRPTFKPLAPVTNWSATLERPLFAPDRRPPPPAPAADSSQARTVLPPSAHGLRIVGFMMGNGSGGRRALIRAADEPQGVWVEAGASIAGWRVAEIGEQSITLESGAHRRELRLFETLEPASRD